jgi:hypothetical protein
MIMRIIFAGSSAWSSSSLKLAAMMSRVREKMPIQGTPETKALAEESGELGVDGPWPDVGLVRKRSISRSSRETRALSPGPVPIRPQELVVLGAHASSTTGATASTF